MQCPGCETTEMALEVYEGNYGTQLNIDVCHACNGLWFDGRESMMLSPGATLKLFASMQTRQASARAPLVDRRRCPHCRDPLADVADLARGTRFSYSHCRTHGRYTTFFQWLREKGLVRAPTPLELQQIRDSVKMVDCSNCGAPIALDHALQCTHCSAPVSIVNTESIQATMHQLHAKEMERTTFKPEKLAEAMMLKHQLQQQYRREEFTEALTGRGFRRPGADLVGLGLRAVLSAFFG